MQMRYTKDSEKGTAIKRYIYSKAL